jgi:hypothetical protein
MNIYVASSWRNDRQQECVKLLRLEGHDVYDFHNPLPGNHGFHWSEIDHDWLKWTSEQFRQGLLHPVADAGFSLDWNAMQAADAGVLLLPCGRSAHLEAGYFVGARKPLWICLPPGGSNEPELMYKMGTAVVVGTGELLCAIDRYAQGVPHA